MGIKAEQVSIKQVKTTENGNQSKADFFLNYRAYLADYHVKKIKDPTHCINGQPYQIIQCEEKYKYPGEHSR
jgi:hypothetical protein